MIIQCRLCNIELASQLQEVRCSGQLKEIDGEDFINQGKFFISDGNYYMGSLNQVIINLKDLKNSKNHVDLTRRNGCCGLDGMNGPNTLCSNGHEIGTEKSDCWMAHAFIFESNKIKMIGGDDKFSGYFK